MPTKEEIKAEIRKEMLEEELKKPENSIIKEQLSST
jgi:hypothetical protein